jgi:hypothetical protein
LLPILIYLAITLILNISKVITKVQWKLDVRKGNKRQEFTVTAVKVSHGRRINKISKCMHFKPILNFCIERPRPKTTAG